MNACYVLKGYIGCIQKNKGCCLLKETITKLTKKCHRAVREIKNDVVCAFFSIDRFLFFYESYAFGIINCNFVLVY